MSSYKSRKEKRNHNFKVIVISIFLFGLGYYILNYISAQENPFLGNTFHIILGCIMMAVSGIFFFLSIKELFFSKKRKKSNFVFLEKQQKNEK